MLSPGRKPWWTETMLLLTAFSLGQKDGKPLSLGSLHSTEDSHWREAEVMKMP